MASISLNKLDPVKDIRFILFNASQLFFKEEKYLSCEVFVKHLEENYLLKYSVKEVEKHLIEMAEDGFLKHYSGKFALDTLSL